MRKVVCELSKAIRCLSSQWPTTLLVSIDFTICQLTPSHRPIYLQDHTKLSGTLVATGSADRTVRVWDVAKGYCTHNFREHTDIIHTVYFHPDPNRLQLFSCSDDNTIRIFDLIDSTCVACFRYRRSSLNQICKKLIYSSQL